MPKVFKVDGVALPDGAILMEGGKTNLTPGIGGLPVSAWYCEPGIGSIFIDDPGGDYELQGWHTFTVDDTDSVGTERQWSGWLIGRRVGRGDYKDGPSRVWDVDIIEINALFGLEVFRANSAQRPDETDVARMTWMLASAPMAFTPVFYDGRFNTGGPTNLPAAEFVRSFPVDMADNAAGQSGKNVYAYWSHADDEIGFHYDLIGAGPDCTLRVSNVIADTDSTTFYPFLDAELSADAYGLYTGVLLDYIGGAVYGRNATLIAELSPTEFSPVEFHRDQMLRSDRIGKLTTANTFLATYLAAAATEKEDITFKIRVPPEQVGLIEAGMNIDCRFTHMVGLESFTTLPIIRLSKSPTPERTDLWDVTVQVSQNVKTTLAIGGDPNELPAEPPTTHWWEGLFNVTGDEYAYSGVTRDGFQPDSDYVFQIVASETPPPIITYATSIAPEVGFHTGMNSPDLAIDTPAFANVSGNMSVQTPGPGGDVTVWSGTIHTHTSVDPLDVFDMRATTADGDHSHTHSTSIAFWFDPVGVDDDTSVPTKPPLGQWLTETLSTPDGTQVLFTTSWPYAAASLTVWVDNLDQSAAMTETDNGAGTFTLAFAPRADETVRVRYQVGLAT